MAILLHNDHQSNKASSRVRFLHCSQRLDSAEPFPVAAIPPVTSHEVKCHQVHLTCSSDTPHSPQVHAATCVLYKDWSGIVPKSVLARGKSYEHERKDQGRITCCFLHIHKQKAAQGIISYPVSCITGKRSCHKTHCSLGKR